MTARVALFALAIPLLASGSTALLTEQQQTGRVFTKADYDNAAKFLGSGFNGLVTGGTVNATWLPDERFWYRTTLANASTQIVLVNPAAKTRVVCTPSIPECAGLGDTAPAGAGGGAAGGGRAGGRGGRAGGVGGGGRGGGGNA